MKKLLITEKKYEFSLIISIAFFFTFLSVLATYNDVHAIQITSEKALNANTSVIDFSQFNSEYYHIEGPVQIGTLLGVDITAVSPTSSLTLWNGAYGLAGNGNWGLHSSLSMNGYIAIEPSDNGVVRIYFNEGPISGFGGFMNYVSFSDNVVLKTYNTDGELLELFDVVNNAPIHTPQALNGGEFRGIQRKLPDISFIEISGKGIVFDELTFTSDVFTTIPEPATMILLGFGLLGVAGVSRRKE